MGIMMESQFNTFHLRRLSFIYPFNRLVNTLRPNMGQSPSFMVSFQNIVDFWITKSVLRFSFTIFQFSNLILVDFKMSVFLESDGFEIFLFRFKVYLITYLSSWCLKIIFWFLKCSKILQKRRCIKFPNIYFSFFCGKEP